MNGISVVLPCLNEERTIAKIVEDAHAALVKAALPGEVVVVDNGSTDDSVTLAETAGARVIHADLRGYGAALQAGINNAQFDFVAMMDADLSYPANALAPLANELFEGADMVLGNRLRGRIEQGAMPFLNRYFGTPALSWCLRFFHGLKTYDCNSGMRVFRRDKILALNLCSPGMEFASEMLVRTAQAGLNYREIPIEFLRDGRGRKPHLRRWRDGVRHLTLILRAWWRPAGILPKAEEVRERSAQSQFPYARHGL